MSKARVTDTVFYGARKKSGSPKQSNCVTLVDTNQIVRILPPGEVPLKDIYPKGKRELKVSTRRQLKKLEVCLGAGNEG